MMNLPVADAGSDKPVFGGVDTDARNHRDTMAHVKGAHNIPPSRSGKRFSGNSEKPVSFTLRLTAKLT